MERFLLFDSGCSLCSDLARGIEREASGWLKARSLREPEVKALLDRAEPNWRWEPTLLEVEGDRARAFTGLAMRVRLLAGLGAKRTWRIAKLVRRAEVPLIEVGLGRRRFLKLAGGAALAAVLASLRPDYKAFADGGPDEISALLKDAKIQELKGEEAERLIQQALHADQSLQLRAALPGFSPESEGIRAVAFSGPKHAGRVAAIPLKDKNSAEAFLFFSHIDCKSESGMITLARDGQVITGGTVYRVKGGTVAANMVDLGLGRNGKEATPSSASATSDTCNADCLIPCIEAFGCSGLALSTCIAGLLICPWFPASCIAFAVCAFYCGGAWSYCWTNICCPGT